MRIVDRTDERLIALFQDRSEQAIADTQHEYGGLCQALAQRLLGSREDAEECVNDAMLALWNAIPPAKPDSLRAFLITITKRTALKRMEANAAAKRGGGQTAVPLEDVSAMLAAEDGTEAAFDRRQMQDALRRFLGDLPKDQRIMFVERYWFMKGVREIAEEHGIGQSRVKMSLSRTRAKLGEFLRGEGLI